MIRFLAVALLFLNTVQLSPADRAAQAIVRRAVDGLEKGKLSTKQFERLVPRRNVPTWQRMQRRIRYPQYGALDLAFVLAYYGVDYRRNIQRLLLPYEAWSRGNIAMPPSLVDDSLITDLVLLYDRHHDTVSISALLDLHLDGGPAELLSGTIYSFWQQEPALLLRLAARSKARLGTLENMMQLEGDWLPTRKQLLAKLRRLCHHRDRRVAGAARRLLSMVKRDFASNP